MDQLNLIKRRKSIRSFKSEVVNEEDIYTLLEAARWAPSAGNKQPVEIVIVKSAEQKSKLVEGAYGQKFIEQVPVVFVVCANLDRSSARYGERGSTLYAIQDAAAATQNILLMATALKYGTTFGDTIHANDVESYEVDYLVTWNTKDFKKIKKKIVVNFLEF